MTTTTPDPINNKFERVLVRSTATGFEQGIAATAGLLTCGPLGALASWGVIRGLQGKWTPWFIIGVPSAVVINVVNVAALAVIGSMGSEAPTQQDTSRILNDTNSSQIVANDNLPHYNISDKAGDTTLVQKCQQLQRAQNTNDLGEIMRISGLIGWNHDTPWNTDVDQDCASVGVDTYM
tara:strand:- start:604 stop:1140 length:537 start_codon:yes stop_codon:yes gene_type:complete